MIEDDPNPITAMFKIVWWLTGLVLLWSLIPITGVAALFGLLWATIYCWTKVLP